MTRDKHGQVLRGVYLLVEDRIGLDPEDRPRPGERIDEHLKRVGYWDEVDLADIWFRCEKDFGFKADIYDFIGRASTIEEWERDIAPRLTYDRLAEFIAERVTTVSFDSVEIAGRRCGPAGAFFGMQEVAAISLPAAMPFGPSTPIRGHLSRAQIERIWTPLVWMSLEAIPPLRSRWSGPLGCAALLTTLVFPILVAACLFDGRPAMAGVILRCLSLSGC